MATPAATALDGARPGLAVALGIGAGGALGQVAAFVAILPLGAAGLVEGDVGAVGLLLGSLGFGAAMLATIALVARRSEPLTARSAGLVRVPPVVALAWVSLGGALIAAFAFFLAQLVDLSGVLAVPSELDGRSALAEELGIGRPAAAVDFGAGAVASALGRVVVPAVVAEIVLRGFALRRLEDRCGEGVALVVTSLLTLAPVGFALGGPRDAGALLGVGLLLGLVLGLLSRVTGSLLPGAALSALVMGAGVGVGFGWSAAAVVVLALACGAAALAIALALAVPRLGGPLVAPAVSR